MSAEQKLRDVRGKLRELASHRLCAGAIGRGLLRKPRYGHLSDNRHASVASTLEDSNSGFGTAAPTQIANARLIYVISVTASRAGR